MKYINKYYKLVISCVLSSFLPITARMSGPAIGRAIQTLTKKYIPEAQQKDFTQTEYDQWFAKANTLYERLKESKPDAITRGTPSIQQLFEQVLKKQLSQLKTKAITIPEKEALEAIIKENIKQAPTEISSKLQSIEKELEASISEEKGIDQTLKEIEQNREALEKHELEQEKQIQKKQIKEQELEKAREHTLIEKQEQVLGERQSDIDKLEAKITQGKKELKEQEKTASEQEKEAEAQRIEQIQRLLASMETADTKERRTTAQTIASILDEHVNVLINKVRAITYKFSWDEGIKFSDFVDIDTEKDGLQNDIQKKIDDALENYGITDKKVIAILSEALNNAYMQLAVLQYQYATKIITSGWSIIKDYSIEHPLISQEDPQHYVLTDVLDNPLENKTFFTNNAEIFQLIVGTMIATLEENPYLDEPIDLSAHIKPFGKFTNLGRDLKRALSAQKSAQIQTQKAAKGLVDDLENLYLKPMRIAYGKFTQEASENPTPDSLKAMKIIGTYHATIAGQVNYIIEVFNESKLFASKQAYVPDFGE